MATIKELGFRHYFTVINGERVYENKEMLKLILSKLEGKKAYETIHEEKEPISSNLYAFYFGAIIRQECMASNIFAGFNEKEIHEILFGQLRSHTVAVTHNNGITKLHIVRDDFHKYTKSKMLAYLDELIPYLQIEYGIIIKDKKSYDDLNKYVSEPTVYKNIRNKHDSKWE